MTAKPRCISSDIAVSWSLYTDASYSADEGGGLGAVLVDHHGMCVSWFSLMVDGDDLSFLETGCNETVIGELETLVVTLALQVWISLLASRHTVFFIGNEGAKFSLIRGYSSSQAITCICDLTSHLIDDCVIIPWFTRVASPSDIADPPSRQESHPFLLQSLQCEPALVRSRFVCIRQFVNERVKGPLKRWGGCSGQKAGPNHPN